MSRGRPFLIVAVIAEISAIASMAALGDLRAHALAFLGLFIIAIVAFGCAFRLLGDTPSRAVIVLIALALRLPMLFTEPSLSDDVWRYLHDGRAQLAHTNPFAYAPSDSRTLSFRGPEFQRINHPDVVTIYPPTAQLSFALNALLGSSLLGWRVMLIVAEVATMLLLAGLLERRSLGLRNLALYAWHPLAVVEVAGSAHLEPIGIALLMAGLLAAARKRVVAAGTLLGLSTGFKLVTAALMVVSEHVRKPRLIAATLASLFVVYGFYWVNGPQFGSLARFAVSWEANASIYAILAWLTDGHRARILAVTLLLCAIAIIHASRLHDDERMAACMFAILLLSPVAHPWYVLWLLAFVPLMRTWWLRSATLVWSATIALAYLPADLRLIEYAPVYALLGSAALTAARTGYSAEILSRSIGKTQQTPT